MSLSDVMEQLQTLILEDLKVRANWDLLMACSLPLARASCAPSLSPSRQHASPGAAQVVSYKWVARHFSLDPNQAKR